MSAEGGGYSPCPAEALPELSAAELAMSLSPKSALLQQNLSQLQLQHSTPFSVTDILSPIEEYRKLELANNPPSPYRSNSSGSSINSPLGPAASCGMSANPYAVPLYGGAPVQGYGCGPADLPHYGDMRGAGWYPASNDPSFQADDLGRRRHGAREQHGRARGVRGARRQAHAVPAGAAPQETSPVHAGPGLRAGAQVQAAEVPLSAREGAPSFAHSFNADASQNLVSKPPLQVQEAGEGEGDGGTEPTQSVIIITAAGGGACPGEGRQALRFRRVVFPRAQPLRDAHVGVREPAGAGSLQQPPGLLLPPARRLPAAVLRVSPAAGPGLVEVPTALPRDHVQGRDVF